MELQELQGLISQNYADAVKKITSTKAAAPEGFGQEDIAKQLDPQGHAVKDKTKRQDKIKKVDGGVSTVAVARIPIPMQKRIVNLAAAFLCGNPIQILATPADDIQTKMLAAFRKVWGDNKLDYKSVDLATRMMGETECAEIWYTQPAGDYWDGTPLQGAKYRLRVKVVAPSLGDTLYPVFDPSGDMIAFGREYLVKTADKSEKHFDLYTDTAIYKGVDNGSGYISIPEPNIAGKIPVIYYSQPLPEWADVQDAIERLETSISNTADTNDYFGSPMVFVEGDITGFADKGESGKVLIGKGGAKAEYLTWDQAPEAVKYETSQLRQEIYAQTSTPNISFEEMKSLGTYSGIALKMLFIDAHMKAARKEAGSFGEGIQRRMNYIKAALAKINVSLANAVQMSITPKFEYFLPKDDLETMQVLAAAAGPGVAMMSQKTAVSLNPLVENPDEELKQLEDEGKLGSDILTA